MPFRRLSVGMQSPSGVGVTVLADRYRADVHQHGLGDGYCGFSVPLRRLDERCPIRIVCIDVPMVLGTLDLGQIPTTAAAPLMFSQAHHVLAVDQPVSGIASGWAGSTEEPTARWLLQLRCDGVIVAQQRATLFTKAARQYLPDGYHGYSFPLPTPMPKQVVLENPETGMAFEISS